MCRSYYQEVSILVKQARELGITVPMGGGDGWDSPDMLTVAGAEALNNTYFTNHYSVQDPKPAIANFVKAYEVEVQQNPGLFRRIGL